MCVSLASRPRARRWLEAWTTVSSHSCRDTTVRSAPSPASTSMPWLTLAPGLPVWETMTVALDMAPARTTRCWQRVPSTPVTAMRTGEAGSASRGISTTVAWSKPFQATTAVRSPGARTLPRRASERSAVSTVTPSGASTLIGASPRS